MIPIYPGSKAYDMAGTKSAVPSISRVKMGIGMRAVRRRMKGAHSET